MKVSLLAGVVLLRLGMGTALMGILSVGGPEQSTLDSTSVQAPASGDMWSIAVSTPRDITR